MYCSPMGFSILQNDLDYHESEYATLQATVEQDSKLDFNFYFNFVQEKVDSIKFLWEEQMPTIEFLFHLIC